ncbi:metalloregulator ArsR/SmtB family transcription factor [Labrenzia sp. 011]|uniref:helix-turn-helix transcriptional regulator n=1 Tax=Labrenzia sp. 011 TaxID=2171494 RepID=UPI000D508615|nr:metalloregulator ArsR/SmtB family transcription factor [Labrenzia sp. 011]PVB60815.1 transcriptional regulator [Labrenzia sp. 011]
MADRTRTRLLNALKSAGPQTAAELADGLKVTSVAVRQHLDGLRQENLVAFEDVRGSVGRPKRIWDLTGTGHQQFPDNHSNLSLALLNGLTELFGEDGVEKLIAHREAQSRRSYGAAMRGASRLSEKVELLAGLRNLEGYMAEVAEAENGYLLIENHCSICVAATACKGFCRSELNLFRDVLGADVAVTRTEHQLSGDRRCVYTIEPRA